MEWRRRHPRRGAHRRRRVCGPTLPNQLLVIEADISVPVATYDYTQVGFSQRRDRKGQLASYLMSWVEQCDRLGLCDDAPGQLATFSFQVEHNAGDVVLCPGTRLSVSATQTRCASLLQQAPTYSAFAIAANPSWVRSTFAEAGPYRLEFFEGPGGLLAPALDAAVFADYRRGSPDCWGRCRTETPCVSGAPPRSSSEWSTRATSSCPRICPCCAASTPTRPGTR
ncbi:hypothetical protein ACN28S_61655 [Cystobacter fuscus]